MKLPILTEYNSNVKHLLLRYTATESNILVALHYNIYYSQVKAPNKGGLIVATI